MPTRPLPLDTARLAALYRDGYTCQRIAEQCGCGTTTVWRRLVAAGVVRRLPNSTRTSHAEPLPEMRAA